MSLKPLWTNFKYHDHQIEGINWMLTKERVGTSCITSDAKETITVYGGMQCDEMGLGKTIQMTGTMKNNIKRRNLLLAPLAMIETWQDNMVKSGFIVVLMEGRAWKLPSSFDPRKSYVYITNYDKLIHAPTAILGATWDRVILDESHKIRNPDGVISCAARKIIAPLRWTMTGTPLVNRQKDIVSQLAFLGVPVRGYLWEKRFEVLIPQIMIHRSLEELRAVLSTAPPLPIIEEIVLDFKSDAEKAFYRLIQGDIHQHLQKRYARDIMSAQDKLVLITRLRQISVHPQVYIQAKRREDEEYIRADWTGTATKLDALCDLIRSEKGASHKYLVFCQFHDEMELIRVKLLEGAIVSRVEMYHGGMSMTQRSIVLASAKEDSCDVLLIQLHSGGVGLNLQEFDRCIFMSPWWTSALMEQAIARSVRMGQKRVVRVVHFKVGEEKTMNIDRLISGKAGIKKAALDNIFALVSKKV